MNILAVDFENWTQKVINETGINHSPDGTCACMGWCSDYGKGVIWDYRQIRKFLLNCGFYAGYKGNSCILFCHNLKYDAMFLQYFLPECRFMFAGKFYNGEYKNPYGKNIYIRDSFLFFQSSLEKLAKDFNFSVQKQDLSDLENRVISDAEITYLIGKEIDKMVDTRGVKKFPMTAAGLAKKVYTKKFNKYEFQRDLLFEFEEKFINNAYYGGRTEDFIHGRIDDTIYHFDVNSLYPYSMLNLIPHGKADYCKEHTKELYDKNFSGIYHVKINIPDNKFGCLPLKYKVKPAYRLIFPVGKLQGYWTNVELKFAEKYFNAKIEEFIECIYYYENKRYFDEYINFFGEMKRNSKGAQKAFAKLCLNSLYGKTAQKHHEITKFLQNGEIEEVKNERKSIYAKGANPIIACFVTSYARVNLLKGMLDVENAGGNVLYCDTDSIFCTNYNGGLKIDDNEFGAWKEEEDNKMNWIEIYAPKVYRTPFIFRHKGIPLKDDVELIYDENNLIARFDAPNNSIFDFAGNTGKVIWDKKTKKLEYSLKTFHKREFYNNGEYSKPHYLEMY